MDKNEAKIKRLLALMDEDTLTKEDFVKNFEIVIEFIKKTREYTEDEMKSLRSAIDQLANELKENNSTDISSLRELLKSTISTELEKFKVSSEKRWSDIQAKADMLRDGIDADEEVIVDKVLGKIKLPEYKETVLDTPEQLRDKLEILEGAERLDITAVKGFEEAINEVRIIASTPKGGGGSGGVEVFNSTGKVGSGSALKFIGAGVSSITSDGHTSTITISGGGSGGAVDSVNGQTGVVVLDADDIDDTSTTNKFVTSTDITKLGNLSGTNSGNVTLTGEDYLSITGQQITANAIDLDNLSATGTPSASTFLRGDNTWATPSGSGDVSKVGTPVNNQVGVWTGDGTIEGDTALTFDTSTDTLTTVNITASGDVTVADEAYGAGWNGSTEVPTKNAVYDKVETLVPYTGATANVDLGTYDLITDTITSKSSSGLILENNTGGDVLHIGNGGGVNATAYGGWNFDGATADTIASFGASKTLTSLATSTYPSLTELSYVKGVTSAIQTQLNAKGAGTVTSVAALTLGTTGTDLSSSVANGTTTPVITLNVPTASSSNRGALSSTDWSTFNSKQSAISFGTGVQTALGVNIGSAGAPVLFNGALGTPSSGTVTNLTGTASININGTVGATTPTTGVFTTATVNTGLEVQNTDTTVTRSAAGIIAVEGVPVVNTTTAQTVTSKRIQPRTASSTSNANLTPDLSSANVYYRTTQTTGLTINAPTGTPVIGETIMIYVDSAGAETLTIDSTFKVFGAAFPATTTAGKTFMMSAQYNGTDWKTLWANAI